MNSKTSRKTVILLILAISMSIILAPANASALSSKNITSHGSITYSPQTTITVDIENIIGANNYTAGFQLDGSDISRWLSSSTLRNLAQNSNFKLIRFFEHRLGKPCTYWDETTKTGEWDWDEIDSLVQRIFEIGAEPLIVLGFYSWEAERLTSTPTGMSYDPTTRLPNPAQWAAYTAEWVKHFKNAGLPVKYYEIVNEPYHYFGWYGDQPRLGYYMQLYNAAATAMRAQNPNVQLSTDASTNKAVLSYFISNGEKLDFISFHRYGANVISATDAEIISNAETKYLVTTTSIYGPKDAVQVYKSAKGVELPIIMSEGNVNSAYDSGTDPRTRTIFGAVYTALSMRKFILLNFRHSIYFNFASSGTDGIGMVNLDNNKPWYPYYAQKMISNNLAVGDLIVESESSSNDVASLAWINQGRLNILLICKVDRTMTVGLSGVSGQLSYVKIDNTVSWEAPEVVSGVLDSTNQITMEGYTVILITGS